MSFSLVFRVQGFLLLFLGVAMCAPPLVALWYGEAAWMSFLKAIVITLMSGGLLLLACPPLKKQITQREGFLIVAAGWILVSLFGALPFLLHGSIASFTDAYFETVSGFTTTGATVIGNVEALPRSILFWRSMIQWLGGMGIILFSIAILPLLGIGGMQLFKAEVPGPVVEKIKPRIAETARSLWKIYILLSLAQTLLLVLCGMNVFEAACHTFTTMATGGFSTRNISVEAFGNPWAELVIIFFMVVAGTNFTLHYRILHGRVDSMLKDREFFLYAGILCGGTLLLFASIYPGGRLDFTTALRQAGFQAASIMTTTGYSTCNFDTWPTFAKCILLLLMFAGGCAGSTAGGIKCMRILLLLKQTYRELFCMVHPNAVVSIKINGRAVPENILRGIANFIVVYLVIFAAGSTVMALCGLDFMTAVSSTATTLGNIGPGFAGVGPYQNFLWISDAGKWTLTLMMLLGRLELFTLLLLLVPAFWKR